MRAHMRGVTDVSPASNAMTLPATTAGKVYVQRKRGADAGERATAPRAVLPGPPLPWAAACARASDCGVPLH